MTDPTTRESRDKFLQKLLKETQSMVHENLQQNRMTETTDPE